MKLGIIGLPYAGKTTLFEALTKNPEDSSKKMENRISTIIVPDERVDKLSEMYNPRKTIYAHIEYFLPGAGTSTETRGNEAYWAQVRSCDALIHVVRNFNQSGEAPNPEADFKKVDEDMTFSDLVVAEKRLEKIELEKKRGREYNKEEHELLLKCKELLEQDQPLRRDASLAEAPKLRGFTFLSAKPLMIIFNNDDDNETLPDIASISSEETCIALRCKLEHEIAQMSDEDAAEFLQEYHISQPATHRMIRESYALLGLMSFFTVGDDEVRAWTIKTDTAAVDAAEEIHSDIKKGFIRAEVVAYDDLMETGSYAEARKAAKVRLEGKTYPVQDGDIINFRFNV